MTSRTDDTNREREPPGGNHTAEPSPSSTSDRTTGAPPGGFPSDPPSCMAESRCTTKWSAPAIIRLAASSGSRSGACTAYEAILRNTPADDSAWIVHIEPERPWLMAFSIGSTSSPRTSPTITRSAFIRSERRTSSATGICP